jgi:hypothetical protein
LARRSRAHLRERRHAHVAAASDDVHGHVLVVDGGLDWAIAGNRQGEAIA